MRRWSLNWPDTMLARLPYAERYTFGASRVQALMNLNNPYDPWQGLGNVEAVNFNLLAAYYKYCQVTACKVTLTIYERSISSGLMQQGCFMFMTPYNPSYMSAPGATDDLFTTRNTSWVTVGNGNTKVYRKSAYYDINKLTGNNQVSKDPTQYSFDCAASTAPPQAWTLQVQQLPIRVGDAATEMDVVIKMVFYCKFWDNRTTWTG